MNTDNSQEQTQTPKYKVGDEVWIVDRAISNNSALVLKFYCDNASQNRGGKTKFAGNKN